MEGARGAGQDCKACRGILGGHTRVGSLDSLQSVAQGNVVIYQKVSGSIPAQGSLHIEDM